MRKRALVLLIGLLLALCCAAYAQVVTPSTFFVGVESVDNVIEDPVDDYADIFIVVENRGSETDTFNLLYLDDPKWSYQALPSPIDKRLTLEPGEEGRIHILVKGDVDPGFYGVKVSVRSENTGNVISNVMRIRVGEAPDDSPPPADFDVDVSVPGQMDPRQTYNIIVNIQNNNERLLEDVNIRLDGKLVDEDTNVTVKPGESKSVSFAVLLMDNIGPQKDQVRVAVDYGGEEFYSADHNFEVVEYVPPFDKEIEVDRMLLRQDRTITVSNEGNALKQGEVRIETSLKERFFSSSDPKYRSVKEGGRYFFAWDVSLEPGESMTIELKTSYRPLLILALIIIALLVYKIATSNPVVVKKKIMSMHRHGGAVADFAVVILLKNRGKEPVTKIRVVELVSKMVHLKKDSFQGSVHPVKMHQSGGGTLLEYRFGELAPGDERIIKYKVHSNLHIFGTITIKPTVVEFVKRSGAKRKSRSNQVSVDTDETSAPKPEKKHAHHKK